MGCARNGLCECPFRIACYVSIYKYLYLYMLLCVHIYEVFVVINVLLFVLVAHPMDVDERGCPERTQ